MAIDFTKPIHTKQDPDNILKVLFHDEISIFYENSAGQRFEVTPKAFERYCENIPEEPRKLKGFMLLVKYPDRMNIEGDFIMPTLQLAKDEIEKLSPRAKVLAIVEINATEGEGLQ
jgi:hypothetical protein